VRRGRRWRLALIIDKKIQKVDNPPSPPPKRIFFVFLLLQALIHARANALGSAKPGSGRGRGAGGRGGKPGLTG